MDQVFIIYPVRAFQVPMAKMAKLEMRVLHVVDTFSHAHTDKRRTVPILGLPTILSLVGIVPVPAAVASMNTIAHPTTLQQYMAASIFGSQTGTSHITDSEKPLRE